VYLSAALASSVTMTGLVNGQTYTCRIEAENAVGWSLPSEPFVGIPVGPPGSPTFLSLGPANESLKFIFEPPQDTNGGPITGYQFVCIRNGETIHTSVVGQPTSFNYMGLTNGVLHECWIHARNAGGSSARSAILSATPADVPSAPALQSVTPTATGATLTFDPPTTNGGSPVIDYRAECLPGPVFGDGSGSPLQIGGLTTNAAFRCRVRARNLTGYGTPSGMLGVIPGAGGSVADLSITKSNATSFINDAELVTYTIVVSNAGPSAVVSARVEDPLNPDFTAGTWRCSAQNAAWCPTEGVGGIDMAVDLPINASVTFLFEVLPTQGPDTPISNQVSVTPPIGIDDPNLANNVASDGPDIRGIFRDGFE
jgi:uncharacterized repeat protein (TIGR01451 family)